MAFNVLIVDDSSVVRSVIGKTITLANIPLNEVFYAVNGEEALKVLGEKWVDIVITDINMPVMDGLELIDRISKDGLMSSIPVVVVSTEGSTTRIEELKAKGVRGYIRKPFTPEQISGIFKEILGDSNAN
ncbi:MAG: two-component system response regulator [Lentisphaerae bacterium GWF2_52_8]|nr:MAG: two-component system response regulator [Lentisphaerae bacterium GWF2_52_8]